MKIVLTTIREIRDSDLDLWIDVQSMRLPWINKEVLKKTGNMSFSSIDSDFYTKATTTIEIIKSPI